MHLVKSVEEKAKEEWTMDDRQGKKSAISSRKGAADEFELMKLIVLGNKVLFQKVMDKIRTFRETAGETILDSVGRKQAKLENAKRFQNNG